MRQPALTDRFVQKYLDEMKRVHHPLKCSAAEFVLDPLIDCQIALTCGLADDPHDLLEEALAQCDSRSRKHLSDRVDLICALAYINYQKGLLSEAERKFLLACKLADQLRQTELLRRVDCLEGLYFCLCKQGRYMQALNVGLQALTLREKVLGNGHAEIARNLILVGMAQRRLEDYVEAKKSLSAALKIYANLPADYEEQVKTLRRLIDDDDCSRRVS